MKQRFQVWLFVSVMTGVLTATGHLAYAAYANIASSPAVDAKALFDSKCAKCHGNDGRASSFKARHIIHARDLTNAEWQNDVSDERIFNSISNGKGKMPSFKKDLSEDQIDALVTYVRRLRK